MKHHYVIFHAVARCEYDFNENYHLPRAQREISSMLSVCIINLICLTNVYILGVRACAFIFSSNFVLMLREFHSNDVQKSHVNFLIFPWKWRKNSLMYDIT